MDRKKIKGVRLGIDMGGTYTKFAIFTDGEKTQGEILPTPKESAAEIVAFLTEKCRELTQKFAVKRIGIGVPGVVKNGKVFADNLPLWDVPLYDLLKRQIKKPIAIDNDANCAALAEVYSVGPSCKNLVMVTIGTGIGGGIVLDGRIRRGRGGMGEIGHMSIEATSGEICSCGFRGCWESLASASALVRSAEDAAAKQPGSFLAEMQRQNGRLDGILIFRAIRNGCPVAKDVFSDYLDRLAVGIKNLIYIFDPDVVVLAGGVTKDGGLFIDDLRERVGTDVPIRISTLQNEAGVRGAALL